MKPAAIFDTTVLSTAREVPTVPSPSSPPSNERENKESHCSPDIFYENTDRYDLSKIARFNERELLS